MGRWAGYRRRGTSRVLSAVPSVVSANVDPGAFGPTDGILTVTFDRPLEQNSAVDLEAFLPTVGFFSFGSAPAFVPGTLVSVWQSASWTPGTYAPVGLHWTGTDGPIVFVDGSELGLFIAVPCPFI